MLIAVFVVLAGISFFDNHLAIAAENSDPASNEIYQELMYSKRLVTGQIENIHGVPCVKARLRIGESIYSFCQMYPSLKKHHSKAYGHIAFINVTNYTLKIRGRGNDSTEKVIFFVPIDFSVVPRSLPEYDERFADRRKQMLVDLAKCYAGCYEYGELKYCFPMFFILGKYCLFCFRVLLYFRYKYCKNI